ncbi:anti-sigma factor [Janibacter sp. G349]|uniref:anti-sigma factor n=1 Tax=Janibacter sp. G349 TaxID=3405424 RepID=UPI003B7E8465
MSDDLHSLSGAYVLDALDDGERADFEEHLARCATCRDEVDSFGAVPPLLAETVAVTPPPALRAEVLRQAAQTRQDPPPVADERQDPGRRHDDRQDDERTHSGRADEARVLPLRQRARRRWVALAAAAALVVGGGVTWQVVDRATTSISEEVMAAPDAHGEQVTATDGGTVRVVRSERMGKAVLQVTGLADPGSGRAYQAWLQDASGEMTSAGMVPGTDGEMLLEGDVATAKGVGLSIEPADGSRQPTTDPVALVELG